ncbi:MAG TPA: 4'-phosphopantetheinyl transferase [Verrucomicrobiae bacterium]|nr:4'-phosphopantetheinyl transferase [Verrucomicrobiae bacterium]
MTPEILFDPPPRSLKLVYGDTHVFFAALDQPLSRLARFAGILSADERARAARYIFERDRNRFLAGRGLLREMLGRLLRVEPDRLVFAYGDHGKPRLASPVAGRLLYFNLAHSDALAAVIVSAQHEVGIDVERLRPIREAEAIAARFFSARENEEWRLLPAGRADGGIFHLLDEQGGIIESCWPRPRWNPPGN